VRQPEVARLAALLLALVLVVPVAQGGHAMLVAGAFLVEFLSQGRLTPLSALTETPARERLPIPGVEVDRYAPAPFGRGRTLVLVHGVAPQGKDDPRAREAAALLARAGFDVLVPTVPGLTRGRLRPDDVAVVRATLAARRGPAVVLGVSLGSGPALLAAADPSVRERVSAVVSLGGYASALEVLRFWLTGVYEYGEVRGRVRHDPDLVRAFVRMNADLLEPSEREALESADPERAARVLALLPATRRRDLEALSPLSVARAIPGRLVLIHGRGDRAVPYTESLRLAAARPAPTRLVLVSLMDHVETGRGVSWQDARDVAALWRVVYALLAGS
jgi:pimeloyl-ACP methyl ester carboxylesterase